VGDNPVTVEHDHPQRMVDPPCVVDRLVIVLAVEQQLLDRAVAIVVEQ